MTAESPFPYLGGKYLVDLSALPESLRQAVRDVVRCQKLAEESRRMADERERRGADPESVEVRRWLVRIYELSTDRALTRLWAHHGLERPVDFTLENLEIKPEIPEADRRGAS